jgi:tetrahedral aminopeptidase
MIDPLLKSLLEAPSPPGNEHPTRDILVEALAPYGTIHKTRWTGFYMSLKGNKTGQPDVVITAHMDSPGFTVRDVNDNGTLDIIHLGGINPSVVNPRLITLRTSKKNYSGVLQLIGEAQGKLSSYMGFFGFKSKKIAVQKGVQKGDAIAWRPQVIELEGNYLTSSHPDNRVGCFLLVEVAKALSKQKKKLGVNVHFAATGCEEVGGRGARIMGQMIEPELAICFDTTYEEGSVKMGAGSTLTMSDASVILPMNVRDKIEKIAKKEKIPIQWEVYNYAGTDAEGFRDVGQGCLTICPLVPSLYNHTPHEIVSLDDVEACKRLAIALVNKSKEIKVV